jgi:predicted nucleic acid-binding protein
MIVLDTNVVSALISAEKILLVGRWLDNQAIDQIWISAIAVFEIRMGIERLVGGRKRRDLEEAFREAISMLEERILPFDSDAAQHAARVHTKRLRLGRPMDIRDAQTAGIVLARTAALATRNVRDFANLGIVLIDPWTA